MRRLGHGWEKLLKTLEWKPISSLANHRPGFGNKM